MANIEQKFREACQQSGLVSILKQLNNAQLNGALQQTMNIMKQSAGGNSVIGFIKSIGETANVAKAGNQPFNKRVLVLDVSRYDPMTGEKYENLVSFNFVQRHCDDLNCFAIGEKVEVTFAISGNEWEGKIINDIIGFRIERIGQPQGQQPTTQTPAQQPAQTPQAAPQQGQTVAPTNTQGADTQDSQWQYGNRNDDMPF